jgi:hypothetical protein
MRRASRRVPVIAVLIAVLLVSPYVLVEAALANYLHAVRRGPAEVTSAWSASLNRASIGNPQDLEDMTAEECQHPEPSGRELFA